MPQESLAATLSPALPVIMPARSGNSPIAIDLAVSATGWVPANVVASMQAPAGWSISPAGTQVHLRPNGTATPVSSTVPLQVAVPATAPDGHYMIDANVKEAGLRFTAQADVLVAHTIDFDTGTVAETPWLWDADHSQSNGVQNRFADGTAHFTYRFPLPSDTTSAQVTLTIDNEYLVQVSSDGQNWTTVLQESQPVTDGSNKADQTIDLTPYLGAASNGAKPVYVKVSDSFPNDGWGGRVYHVKANIVE